MGQQTTTSDIDLINLAERLRIVEDGLGVGGWIPADKEAWTYASASTFTILGDCRGVYSAGMRLRLTQSTVKYFTIASVAYSAPNTTITVSSRTYSLVNAVISDRYFSYAKSPLGWPYLADKEELWPVGSVFVAVVATNPATLLGFGTWAQLAQGQMLVGFKTGDADFGTIKKTGGAKTATHTNNHAGCAIADHPSATNKQGTSAGNVLTTGNHSVTQPAAHADHNILNPYCVVYVWERTA